MCVLNVDEIDTLLQWKRCILDQVKGSRDLLFCNARVQTVHAMFQAYM